MRRLACQACLEDESQAELHHAWTANGVCDLSVVCTTAANCRTRSTHNIIRRGEIRFIENVEHIHPQVRADGFRDARRL